MIRVVPQIVIKAMSNDSSFLTGFIFAVFMLNTPIFFSELLGFLLCQSSGIVETRKQNNVSETGSVSVLWGGGGRLLLWGPLI
jgi:hypothetical protein